MNAKFRYGTTALFKAAERGHPRSSASFSNSWGRESERHLLRRDGDDLGAPIGRAREAVRALLERTRGDCGRRSAAGTRNGNAGMVRVALETGRGEAGDFDRRARLRVRRREAGRYRRDAQEGGPSRPPPSPPPRRWLLTLQVPGRAGPRNHHRAQGRQALVRRGQGLSADGRGHNHLPPDDFDGITITSTPRAARSPSSRSSRARTRRSTSVEESKHTVSARGRPVGTAEIAQAIYRWGALGWIPSPVGTTNFAGEASVPTGPRKLAAFPAINRWAIFDRLTGLKTKCPDYPRKFFRGIS